MKALLTYSHSLRTAQKLACAVLLWASAVGAAPAMAQADLHDAVILIYHRFGEADLPSTNIRMDQFREQIEELEREQYTVLPLGAIVEAFAGGRELPERTVAITVDDAYASFADNAWPLLKARGWAATLFVATDPVDQGLTRYMDWDTIRRLKAEGVEIGHHGAGHIHMTEAGLKAARADIERASVRFREELGSVPELFAYPYGEFSAALEDLVKEMGFKAAMAQHSSVAWAGESLYSIPRFPFNERYATMDRFRLIANARALPATGIVPRDPVLGPEENPPAYGFTLTEDIPGLSALACYPSHAEPAKIETIGGNRVEVRVDKPFPPGRGRINCTLPGPGGRWYWRGAFFYVPGAPD